MMRRLIWQTPEGNSAVTIVRDKERMRFYFQVVAALAPRTLKDANPSGIAHLAADIVDAAIDEMRRRALESAYRRPSRQAPRRPTAEEEVALRRKQLGLPETRPNPDDD
jgi:hypothetical protein